MISPESEIFLWIKPKKKRKPFFVESLDQCRRLEEREKARNVFFLRWNYVCLTTRCYTTSHLHQVFFDFARSCSLFSLVFCTSIFRSLMNLIKQLFIRACWIWDFVYLYKFLSASLFEGFLQRNPSCEVFYTNKDERKKNIETNSYKTIIITFRRCRRFSIFTVRST